MVYLDLSTNNINVVLSFTQKKKDAQTFEYIGIITLPEAPLELDKNGFPIT